MSIFPATDIVSDVARAADPRKVQVAMKRLNDFASARMSAGQNFAAAVDRRLKAQAGPPMLARAQTGAGGPAQYAPEAKPPAVVAAEKFEAYILQTWLEALLPKAEGMLYGSDGAGGVWRSMMAEQLGGQIAKSGGVGLRKLFENSQALHAASSAAPPSRA
jgi:hypothetical protein